MQHYPKKFWMPHWPIPKGNRDINLGLSRMEMLLDKIGNPHRKLPPVIHVAGTNGKGSTLAYLQAMFEAAGYSVHKYISPHLRNFNERITLNGNFISNDFLTQLAEECRLASEENDIPMTFFEGITAMAFLAFATVPADILLLEVGMGGRLDATNVIEEPIASVITSISFDHMEFLGNSLPQIAFEKAGILKSNCLGIFSWQPREVMDVLVSQAEAVNCIKYACGDQWTFNRNEDESFNLISDIGVVTFPKPSLVGIHQYVNGSTAAMTAMKVMKYFPKLSLQHIASGISNGSWPGRMERITKGVLSTLIPPNFELWLDGAHNEAGAQMLAANLQLLQPEAVIYIIHGRTIHRDMKVFLKHLANIVELVSAIEIMGEPDSEDPHRIKAACSELNINAIVSDSIIDSIKDIVSYHEKKFSNGINGRIAICGSLFLAGDVMLANKT